MIGQLRKTSLNSYITPVSFTQSNNSATVALSSNSHYYVKFNVTGSGTVTLYLRRDGAILQKVNSFTVESGASALEAVFEATGTYDEIYAGTTASALSVTFEEVAEIVNVIDTISSVTTLTQIGIQGPSGLLMDINGEQIRVGRFGVYEPIKNIDITFMGFVPDDSDFFILDYQGE